MLSSLGVPDDERKGRRLGDETKGRIADLASGWTVDSDAPPAPEPPIPREATGPSRIPREATGPSRIPREATGPSRIPREATGPSRIARDAARREAKPAPPPPPGSAARKSLEDKISELIDGPRGEADPVPEVRNDRPLTGRVPMGIPARSDPPSKPLSARSALPASPSPPSPPSPPVLPSARSSGPPPPPSPARPRTSQAASKPRATREGDPLDLSTIPEADKTKENRGAVGIKHDKASPHDNNSSLTTNAASGTIGGDTPAPLFDRAAIGDARSRGVGQGSSPMGSIAAGQKGALASERVTPGEVRTTGTGPNAAVRGTPKPGSIADASPPASPAPPSAVTSVPPSAPSLRPAQVQPDTIGEARFADLGPTDTAPRLAVPVGEFDHDQTILEQDKLRVAYTQATIKRDAAGALLGLAEPAPPAVKPVELLIQISANTARGDSTSNDWSGASTRQYERGDPTLGDDRGDATSLSPPAAGHAPAGTLRSSAALPRKRGIAGDIRYVATVVFGVRAANRELAELEAQQATRQKARRHHLVTLGRTAVTSEGTDHPALGPSRDQLSGVEEERSQHAGHVVAADTELTRVRRDREAKAKQYVADLAALDGELATSAKKLEPLDKEAAGIRKRVADLRDAMRRIDAKIAATEASLTSIKGGRLDRAGVQAEIATLKAERREIQSDEPVIAGQLDALNPRIAALEAARGEAQRKRAELERAEQEDQRRVEELLTAIGAKRKVVDRAAADAEALRDKILFQLGERLYVDRPRDLTGQLAPIDDIDVELGIADRRVMELREIVSSVDKLKIARGIALIVLILGAIGALAFWGGKLLA
jgi:prefoldin subunit 5